MSFLLREIPLRDDVSVGSTAIEGIEEAGFGMLGEPGPPGLDDGYNQGNLAPASSAVVHPLTVRPRLSH